MGDPHDAPMAMDFFVWVILGSDRGPILVDLGFSHDTATKRRRTLLCDPIESLRLLDIDPAKVKDVIVTHLHYDHAGNFRLLPAATFHIQEPEIHFATSRHVRHKHFQPGYEVEDMVDVVRLNYAGRVMF
jgi:glyoxylase-like metal-dependent hydrolase (beta-lactamase superfamily II)